MRGIPGERFVNDVVSVGDYNNDGINEVFGLGFYGAGFILYIYGIDPVTEKVTLYCKTEFYVPTPTGFAPVEFIRYKGKDGFKLAMSFNRNGDGLKYGIEGLRGVGWYFFTWDEDQQKYVFVEEVDPGYDE
jgi:hypothetical protein